MENASSMQACHSDDRLTVAAFLDRWLTASLPGR
jgi:hypothetical protein